MPIREEDSSSSTRESSVLAEKVVRAGLGVDSIQALPEPRNICAVVVSYCAQAGLLEHLRGIAAQVGRLVVVDNGSSEFCRAQLKQLSNVHLILNPQNEGVARALNQGVQWAVSQGFHWILTLDQDTVVDNDMVDSLCAVLQDIPDPLSVAVIGSNYMDATLNEPFLPLNENIGTSWLEVKTTITSGSLISVSALHQIGPFREEFFIDFVDFEYCLRARSKGFRVVMTRKPLMIHSIGNSTMHQLPWKTTSTSNHSPIRRYFMTRNQLALAKKYLWTEPRWTLSMLYRQFKATVLMCIFEKNVPLKLKFTVLGMLDGLASNFSRIPKL